MESHLYFYYSFMKNSAATPNKDIQIGDRLDDLRALLPDSLKGRAGHLLSVLLSRLQGREDDKICRRTDTREYLEGLADFLEGVAGEFRAAAAQAPETAEGIPPVEKGVISGAITQRILDAIGVGLSSDDVRLRESDDPGKRLVPPHNQIAKRKAIQRLVGQE